MLGCYQQCRHRGQWWQLFQDYQQRFLTFPVYSINNERVLRQLALEWIQSSLPAGEITFVDCLKALGRLQASTQNVDRSEAIFELVFQQAKALAKSSEWVADELDFEIVAHSATCRAEVALLYLTQNNTVDGVALDRYNERLDRYLYIV